MANQPIQFLAWDTKQLGVPTARIELPAFLVSALHEILKNARHQGLKLLYLILPIEEQTLIQAAKEMGGFLADHKVTYLMNFTENLSFTHDSMIETYQEKSPTPDLVHLAYESGKYSRFNVDPRISETQFHQVYLQWITNSVNHSVADEVYVMRNSSNKIVGMITLGEKNQRGDIGLLAVDESARGQRLGTKLVQTAQHYFKQKGYLQTQVVTQQTNIPACSLYEKCDYQVEKIEYFFHFWL